MNRSLAAIRRRHATRDVASIAVSADHGEALTRLTDPHSRPGFGQPALFPRPMERAPGIHYLALQLAFDSFREPAPLGHRGSLSGERHLLYISREYALDLHLQSLDLESSVLRGELLSRSDGPVAEVPAFLLDGSRIAGYACTGSLGEFRLEADGAADLRLCLLLDPARCIDLPIEFSAGGEPGAG